jgi:hypothetical protein
VVIRIHKKIITLALLVAIAGAAVMGVTMVNAQTPTPASNAASPTNPMTSLVQKIAQKFGLKEADVQAVFDQNRQDHMDQMQTRYESTLDQAVKDGKLKEAQKQLLLAKHKELQSQKLGQTENWGTMTPEQRKEAMLKQHQELQDWAKQNNIDIQYLFGFGGKGMMMGRHMGWRNR